MRLIANESHIKSRTRVGELAPFSGLLILAVATLVVFWKPEWSWATLLLIWVGFIISLIGGYLGGRYVGPLAHHKKVPEALKGLENSFTLLMYKTPAPFVLVDAGGVTVITVRSQSGKIAYQNSKWQHKEKMGWLRRFAGQEGVGRPDQLAMIDMEEFQRFLRKRLPEGVEVPVRTVILFVHPDAEVTAEGSPVPVFRIPELKRWLRREGRRPNLSKDVLQQLTEALKIEAEG